ncbi:MAG: tRNA (N(6)-L-threonylcarbamoyladenosine(37)-C(2))-methylthiotransferase MtaB [Anaerovoracaceae bacterium]
MKVAFHTLGCKVNQYETEAMKEQFSKAGYDIVMENDFSDVYVINTCTVTSLADRKSRQYIRRMKKLNPESIVVVTGCYAQVSSEEVRAIDGVDIVCGTNEKNNIIDYVSSFKGEKISHILEYDDLASYDEAGLIRSMESRTRAYIKVQEGCNRFCSYCIIPYARGPVRSRKTKDVIEEAKTLINSGFKELILTGINTALCENLIEILDQLEEMDGDFRIRLSSLEPTVINADYVKNLFKYNRLCHHLHLSIQSGSDNVLKLMNRRYDRNEYLDIVKVLRDFDPNYGITTDIIVGFPGEKEEDFLDTLDMVAKVDFGKVHTFKYSIRKGTKAATMADQNTPVTKKERSQRLIAKDKEVCASFFKKNIGTSRIVLFEEYQDGYMTGYTDNYIKVYLKLAQDKINLFANKLIPVKLVDMFNDGVLGETDE